MGNDLFLHSLEDILNKPVNDDQLTAAVKAHRQWRVWDKERSLENWKLFLKMYFKIEVDL